MEPLRGRCYGDDHPQSEGLVVDPTGDESGSLAERLGGSAEPVKAAVARGAIPIDPRKAMGQSGRPS